VIGSVRPLFTIVFAVSMAASRVWAQLPSADPAGLGFDADRLRRIDGAIDRAIGRGQVPGAVVLVGRRGSIAYARAAGRRVVGPAPEEMTRDTAFDMASLTKPVATATSIMILIEEGKLRLTERLGRLLPEFDNHGKGAITIDQLLRHRAGLIPDDPIADYQDGPETAWKKLAGLELVGPPGERFRYSDVGFLILGRLVERISGERLDRFASKRIFDVLGMKDTRFRPMDNADATDPNVPVGRVAPTEPESRGGRMLRGIVHDPRSRALGGVAGHAGLFSTADDLAIFAQMLLNGGVGPDGRHVLSPLAVRMMIDPADTPPDQRRGLGWDVQTNQSAPHGGLFGPTGFGHTGFTGTSLWVDPETQTFVVILTSRLHPDGRGASPTGLRFEVATLAAAAIADAPSRPLAATVTTSPGRSPAAPPPTQPTRPAPTAVSGSVAVHPVRCGIDVLVEEGFRPLRNKKVGLVTNHTGRTRGGASTIDVLSRAPGVKLVKLFSPEHGIRGEVDVAVPDSTDVATGLPIVSLYGRNRKPSSKDLEGIDFLVYDIQDIGARFYTYITTLGLVLESAKDAGKAVLVLDRPNPIGGLEVSGPLRDDEFASFIAYHALPVRHGMTVGELARLYNTERKIGASLEVIACRGWSRADRFERTGLVWINPSPNMRSLTEALLYPGIGMLEATNLATGRGTDTPFERVGAPWIDPEPFAAALNEARIPGARFVPIVFTPTQRQYSGTRCGGVYIIADDWSRFDPIRAGIAMAVQLRRLHPDEWKPEGMLRLMANRATYQDILAGKTVDEILKRWDKDLVEFRTIRDRYLIYR
jgi:uncharacterized protein YbbC (DUF1343 family)/CubicO group peptidase (beta-lactamase class C family)